MSGDVLKLISDRIAERFRPQRVILFGSYANGKANADSDVDLLIVSDDGAETRDAALAIRKSLADLPIACDIIVSTAHDFIRDRGIVNHIAYVADRYGKVIYER